MKRFIIGLLAVAGLAGAGYTTYENGYDVGRAELAWASPSDDGPVLLAQADVADAGTAPLPATEPAKEVTAAPTAAPAVVSTKPCIDRDGAGPSPCIESPLDHPRESLDTVAAARKLGWPVLGGAALFFLLVLAGKWVPYLREGKRALYLSGGTAVVAAGVNAGFLGGDALAMVFAAGGVLIALVQGDRTLAASQRQAKGGV